MISYRDRIAGAAALASLLVACSGTAPGGDTTTAGPVPPPAVTDAHLAQHVATMSAIDTLVDALLATSAQPSSQALAAAIAAAPGVRATGVSSAQAAAAWAELVPGNVTLTVSLGPDPDPAATIVPEPGTVASQAVRAAVATASTAPTYAFLSDGEFDRTPQLQRMFDAKGYRGWRLPLTVPHLRALGSPNVLYITAHGGVLSSSACYPQNTPSPPPCFGIATIDAVPLSQAIDAWPQALRGDLYNRRLDYYRNYKAGIWKFAINQNFIRTYFRFKDESLFFLTACYGATAYKASEWQRTLFEDLNLATYLGWDGAVDEPEGGKIAELFFDRMLGANSVDPIPDPPQRPFDPRSVFTELGELGKNATYGTAYPGDPTDKAYLRLLERSSFVGAPSIATVATDARAGRLTAAGKFPKDPGASRRTVKVSGTTVPVVSWTEDAVVTELPPGNGGDVVVTSDGVDGNPVQLTEFRATIRHDFESWLFHRPDWSSSGTATFTVRFRADVHDFRPAAGAPPVKQVLVPFEIEEGTLAGDGSATYAGQTSTYSGDTSLLGRLDYSTTKGWVSSNTWPFPVETDFLDGLGWIDVSSRKLYLALYGTVGGGVRTWGADHGTVYLTAPTTCNLHYLAANGVTYLVLDLEESFTVANGSCKSDRPCIFGEDCALPTVGSDTLTWQFVTAAPPDLQAPR